MGTKGRSRGPQPPWGLTRSGRLRAAAMPFVFQRNASAFRRVCLAGLWQAAFASWQAVLLTRFLRGDRPRGFDGPCLLLAAHDRIQNMLRSSPKASLHLGSIHRSDEEVVGKKPEPGSASSNKREIPGLGSLGGSRSAVNDQRRRSSQALASHETNILSGRAETPEPQGGGPASGNLDRTPSPIESEEVPGRASSMFSESAPSEFFRKGTWPEPSKTATGTPRNTGSKSTGPRPEASGTKTRPNESSERQLIGETYAPLETEQHEAHLGDIRAKSHLKAAKVLGTSTSAKAAKVLGISESTSTSGKAAQGNRSAPVSAASQSSPKPPTSPKNVIKKGLESLHKLFR